MSSPDPSARARAGAPTWSMREAVAIALAALIFIASAASFLPHQSLWVDETTQLSGVALGPVRLMPWLLGHGPDLGVPPDRMPPGAYLLEMAWSSLGGLSEHGLRWFGLVCALIALLATAAAARRAYGGAAGIGAALFLAVSPNVLGYAIEIRAYPVFLMLAALALYGVVRVVQGPTDARTRWLAATTAVLIAAAYTHFFGLVLAVALGAGLLVDAVRRRQPLLPLLGCAAVFAVAFAGVVPFVLSALKMSGGGGDAPTPAGVDVLRFVKFAYRLYAHPALANSLAMTAIASAGIALAAAVALFARGPREPVRAAVVAATVTGAVVVGAAALVVHGFDTLASTYNVWLLPVLALLLSRALGGVGSASARRLGMLGFALLLVGSGYGTWQIHRHADAYAHGPQNQLLALLAELGPARVDVVYDVGASDDTGHVSFPVRYRLGRAQPQYRFDDASARLTRIDSKDPVPEQPERELALVMRVRNTSAAELARRLREPLPAAAEPLPAARALIERGWQPVSRRGYVGLVSVEAEILRRPR